MKSLFQILVIVTLVVVLTTLASAQVPQMINYQGKLTTQEGGCLNDTVSMTFTIYSDDQGTVVDWTEDQDSVVVKAWIFNVLLGSVNPIPASVFDGSTKYLGVQVESDPEMRPLKPMVSVAYAYRAATADSGYVDCEDCDDRFVNMQGPDSVVASSGTAFLGKTAGTSTAETHGIQGYADNSSSGSAYGGFFQTSSSGTGQHYGVGAVGYGSSSYATFGCYGSAVNSSTGMARGGYFRAEDSGTGQHEGVLAVAYGSSSANTFGCLATAHNASTGDAYGGDFTVGSSGTGTHYGVSARGYGSSSASTYGYYGYADNTSTGSAYGGYFETSSSGTAAHFGVYAKGRGFSSGAIYGLQASVENASTGPSYGGDFYTSYSGTGGHVGVSGLGRGSSSASTYGCYGYADNTSTGIAFGGSFSTDTSGTGYHCGVMARGYSSSPIYTHGIYGHAMNTSSGDAYGGYFDTSPFGTGVHYGVYGYGQGSSSSPTYGYIGCAYNNSAGDVFGGHFSTLSTGTGIKYGVYASAPVDQGWAGYFDGEVRITDSLVVLGGKSAAVKVDNGEYRLLYSQESAECWFEDFGEGRLENGKAVIEIDPLFAQTVNTTVKYHVFLTPQDKPLTLAVANKTATSFEVKGPEGANISFSYRLVAKRKGYENLRLAKMGGPTPEEVAAEQERHQTEFEQERVSMEQERQKMEEERMEMEKERESR